MASLRDYQCSLFALIAHSWPETLLTLRAYYHVKGEPGLIGVALHKSTDGLRVVNYAQWRSEEDLRRFTQKYHEPMEAQIRLTEGVDPHVYEVAYLDEPTKS